ncbi:MAG: hypothetical protein ACRDSF_03190 [Pseudonocardiaceae bacterium]
MTAPRSPWVPDDPDTPNIVPPPTPVVRPEPQRADGDILVECPELGPNCAVLITDGQPIPAHLVYRPRRPARPDKPPRKRG